jgi:hypothetical protein
MAYIDAYAKWRAEETPNARVYFLMRVYDAGFDFSTIEELEIGSKMGNIWCASGTKKTLDALAACTAVTSVEASR